MASLLEKIQTLIAADLNRLVDGATRSSEPAMFRQHIRDLQQMQEQLTEQMITLRGQITQMRRKSDDQQAIVTSQDLEVDRLLQSGLEPDALAAQDRLNQNRLAASKMLEKVERLEFEYDKLAETKAQLDARLLVLRQSEPEVEGLASAKQAKAAADAASQRMDDMQGAGDADVDRVVSAIRNRLEIAETQLAEMEQRGLARGETPDALKRKELEAQLEARKVRLGLAEPPPAAAPVSATPPPVEPATPAPTGPAAPGPDPVALS